METALTRWRSRANPHWILTNMGRGSATSITEDARPELRMGKLVFILALAIGTSALAEPEETLDAGTSTMSQSDLNGGMLKKVYTDLTTTFHGPTLNKFGPYSVGNDGKIDPTAESGFDSEAEFAYKLNEDGSAGIGPNLPFVYQPNITNNQMVWGDVGIKWFNKKTIKTENFQLATSAYLQAPTSNFAHQENMNFALQAEPWFIYRFAGTPWLVGSWSEFRYLNGVTEGLAFKVWLGPYVSYKLSSKLALNLMYETEQDHFVGNAPVNFRYVSSDFQPGLVWDITPSTKINPYIQIFPVNHLATDVTAIGFVFYSRIL